MVFTVAYLLQESFILSCTTEDYARYMKETIEAGCSDAEIAQLKLGMRRVRNREYAKKQRDAQAKEARILLTELERLRRENEQLRRTVSAWQKVSKWLPIQE